MRYWSFFVLGMASLAVAQLVSAQSVSTTLDLDSPSETANVVTLSVAAGSLGSDTEMADLTGSTEVTFDLTPSGSGYNITGLTFTGGTTSISDVTFSLAFGISAVSSDLAATPYTTMAPSQVTGGSFVGADHGVTVDQGTVTAAGSTIDFASSSFSAPGTGTGSVTTSPGTPVAGFDVLDVVLELPITFAEPFDIPNVPILGTVTANFSGTGTLKASGTLQIPIESGLACDFDSDEDCQHDDLAAMYSDIAAGTAGGQFDFDGDGTVTADDIAGWLVEASDASNTALVDPGNDMLVIGDVNLDGDVNSADLGLLLNKFGSDAGGGWEGGDLNADKSVTSADLGQLLNRFGHASLSVAAVPEPTTVPLQLFLLGTILASIRSRRRIVRAGWTLGN